MKKFQWLIVGCLIATVGYSQPVQVSVPILGGSPKPGEAGSFHRVDLKLVSTTTNDFRIAMAASSPLSIEPTVRDTLWLAAYAAARQTGKPLSGRRLEVDLPCAMRGTSAGLALTLGIASALENRQLPSDFAVTGEILPNGIVGPVSELTAKIAAAAESGIRRVAIPVKPLMDTVAGKEIDPVDFGKKLGVEVVRVRTFAEARAWMERKPYRAPETDERQILALPPAVAAELTRQTTNLLARLAAVKATNLVKTARMELQAGRLFSARQLVTLSLSQRMGELKNAAPATNTPPVDARAVEWVSSELCGMEEKLRQEAEQGAPDERLRQGRCFMAWMKSLQIEQATALLPICDALNGKVRPDDCTHLLGVAIGLADIIEQLTIMDIAAAGQHSVGKVYQMLYPVDMSMLLWQLTLMRLQHGELQPNLSRVVWVVAGCSATLARFGGRMKIGEDRTSDTLSVTYGCEVFLQEYMEESRQAALAAIARERAQGFFPALAIDAFERGERMRIMAPNELNSRLETFESYLRSYLLCGQR